MNSILQYPEKKVLAISGSPREGGNSDVLLNHFALGVRTENISCEVIQLRDFHILPCIGCEACRTDGACHSLDDDMQELYPKFRSSRGLIMVSPTHNYNITSWLKAFIDRLYCFYQFTDDRPRKFSSHLANQGRQALIAGICEQPNPAFMGVTLDAMRLPLADVGYQMKGELPVYGIFDKGKVGDDQAVLDQAIQLGRELAKAI
ncbi:flavodoxin family protein [Desulfoluna butyratoxydans]|uniref:Nadph-dependent fmn reductase-like n=1 Tax=Desulfoluna butyratoxydans TaxID=231438 RepID=A0A4V6ILJ5_9BACT|nr:flavodoxin family protein [Desulfoluna butyratoxydans]VFQ45308.1 nadph-dependent fmn reductase-like [Desulfoluna butyratoxydans]